MAEDLSQIPSEKKAIVASERFSKSTFHLREKILVPLSPFKKGDKVLLRYPFIQKRVSYASPSFKECDFETGPFQRCVGNCQFESVSYKLHANGL